MLKKIKPVKKVFKEKVRPHFTPKNAFLMGLLMVFIVQFMQVHTLLGGFSFLEGRDSSLIRELGDIREAYKMFGDDLNEVRNYLRLPSRPYLPLKDGGDIADSSKNKDEVQLALFQYIDSIAHDEKLSSKLETNSQFLNGLSTSATFADFIMEEKLVISKITDAEDYSSLQIMDLESHALITLYSSKDNGDFEIMTNLETEDFELKDFSKNRDDFMDYISDNKVKLIKNAKGVVAAKSKVTGAFDGAKLDGTFKRFGLSTAADPYRDGVRAVYSIKNIAGSLVGEVAIDMKDMDILLIDKNDEDSYLIVDDLSVSLVPFLKKLDSRTYMQKKSDDVLDEFTKTLDDKGFALLLKENGLSISEEVREDEDNYYYDVYDSDENVISVFAIEKATGVIYIMNSDGSSRENLLTFTPALSKKKI